MFSSALFPRLTALYLDSMSTKIVTIQARAFANPALTNLSLMYNNIDFSLTPIHPHSFQGLHNLARLELGHNYFNLVTSQRFVTLFGGLTSLRDLRIGVAFMGNVSSEMVRPLRSLERLMFYDNELTSLPDGVFDQLPNLRFAGLASVVFFTTGLIQTGRNTGLSLSDRAANP